MRPMLLLRCRQGSRVRAGESPLVSASGLL